MSLQLLFEKIKGGRGSGNFGHRGIPGKRGGSGSGGGHSTIGIKPGMSKEEIGKKLDEHRENKKGSNDYKDRPKLAKGYSYGKDLTANDIKVGDNIETMGTSRQGRYGGTVTKVLPKNIEYEYEYNYGAGGKSGKSTGKVRKDELAIDKVVVARGNKVHLVV